MDNTRYFQKTKLLIFYVGWRSLSAELSALHKMAASQVRDRYLENSGKMGGMKFCLKILTSDAGCGIRCTAS